jgi:PAS domain S-box-containing protein
MPTSPLPDGVGVERLRAEAFLSSPNLVVVVDHERRVRAINPAGLALTGSREPDVIGQPLRALLDDDEADAALARIEQALGAERDLEVIFRSDGPSGDRAGRRGGRIVLGLRVAPLVIDGVRCGLIISGRDATNRKRLEHEIQQLASSFQALAEASDLGIYRFSFEPTFRVDHTNEAFAAAVGYSREFLESDASPLADGLSPEVRQRFIDNRFGQQEALWPIEFDWVRPSGEAVVLSVEEVPIRDRAGRVTAALGLCRDVTRERSREASIVRALQHEREAAIGLRQVDDLRRLFLQAVSHELRTPLTAVLGFSATLHERGADMDPEQVRTLSARLHGHAEKIQRLLDDLLDVERLSRGVLTLEEEDHDLDVVVRAVLAEVGDAGVEVSGSTAIVSMDRGKLERVVFNLVSNARRHAGPSARIAVMVTPTDGGAQLIVEDDGPGVDDELKDTVFEPFQQGPRSSEEPSPGTGIGLTLVAEFVRLHGGTVTIGDVPGGGARFTVELPRHPPT